MPVAKDRTAAAVQEGVLSLQLLTRHPSLQLLALSLPTPTRLLQGMPMPRSTSCCNAVVCKGSVARLCIHASNTGRLQSPVTHAEYEPTFRILPIRTLPYIGRRMIDVSSMMSATLRIWAPDMMHNPTPDPSSTPASRGTHNGGGSSSAPVTVNTNVNAAGSTHPHSGKGPPSWHLLCSFNSCLQEVACS